jgi:chitinase
MSETTKARRIGWIKSMNFGGTSDWAVDLSGWFSGSEGDDDPDADLVLPDLSCDISQWKDTLDALYEVIDSIPAQCRARALGNVLVNALMASIEEYETVKQDYDDKVSPIKYPNFNVLTH